MCNAKKAMLLFTSASAGIAGLFVGHAQGASYTYNQTSGTTTWITPANWNQAVAGASFPQLAGDVANLNIALTAAETVVLPQTLGTVTVGTLDVGDTSASHFTETIGGGFSAVMTLDSGVVGTAAVINMDTVGTGNVTFSGGMTANSDVIINVNNGQKRAGITVANSGTGFNATGHTVTINGTAQAHPITFDGGGNSGAAENIAKLWVVNSGGYLSISGASYYSNSVVGDIQVNAGAKMQNQSPETMGSGNLVTNNGFWNLGGPNVKFTTGPSAGSYSGNGTQIIGGLSGTGGTWGPGPMTINGTADVPGVHDYSGAIGTSSLTITGGTQRLSGTLPNYSPTASGNYVGTGPVLVSGGILQLNKTNPAGGTAYAIGSVSSYYSERAVTNGSGYSPNPNANANGVLPASLTITGAGVVELMQPNQLEPDIPVTLNTGGKLKLDTGSGITTIANPITIDGSSFIDVNTEKLVLMSTALSSSAAVALLKTGYAGGAWNGPGIMSSAANAGDHHHGLGYNVDGSGNTTIKFTLNGDTNLDGSVNFTDLLTLAQHYNTSGTTWATGDFNYDGLTNFSDLLALAQNYNTSIAGPAAGEFSPSFVSAWNLAVSETTAVPEPASLGLLAIGAASMLTRRRKQ